MRLVLTCGLVALLAGCGDKNQYDPKATIADDLYINSLVSEILDSDEKQIVKFFTDDNKRKVGKAEYKKLTSYTYAINGKPVVSGDTATANVKVIGKDGKEIGVKEWEFAKEGGKWKIKSAPLP